MKFCAKCGNELADDAQVCMNCGCAVYTPTGGTAVTLKTRRLSRKVKLWIILGTVALFLGVVAAILFMPRNLEMDDLKKTNFVEAIIQYGIPESINTDEDSGTYLQYGDKNDFYGFTPWAFTVYLEENRVVLFFDSNVEEDVYTKIVRCCKFEKNLSGIFHIFSYGDMEITTYDNEGSYVSIDIY